jgi:alpha-N-arabinofuranosidase
VKVACLAQLVNAIGAIRTEARGPAWRQTIFHPFALAARHARGDVLRPAIQSPAHRGRFHPEMPALVASATHDAESRRTAVFALNRNLRDEQELRVELRGFAPAQSLVAAVQLHHDDMAASNSAGSPDAVAPVAHTRAGLESTRLQAVLKPGSWNVFVLEHALS